MFRVSNYSYIDDFPIFSLESLGALLFSFSAYWKISLTWHSLFPCLASCGSQLEISSHCEMKGVISSPGIPLNCPVSRDWKGIRCARFTKCFSWVNVWGPHSRRREFPDTFDGIIFRVIECIVKWWCQRNFRIISVWCIIYYKYSIVSHRK